MPPVPDPGKQGAAPQAGAGEGGEGKGRLDPVDAFIGAQPERVRNLLDMARVFLHGSAPGLREGIKWGVPTFMMEKNLFYLNPQRDHVVLGFCNGAKMPEFRQVFDRVSAEVAHVLVRSVDDLRRPGLRAAVRSEAGLPADEAPVSFREEPPLPPEPKGDGAQRLPPSERVLRTD